MRETRPQPVLSIRDARRRFGSVRALDGVSLELDAGEWVALLGANGAGKTTLLHAIAGILRLDGGSVEIRGDGESAGALRAEVGLVPQEIALYAALSVRENLQVFGRFHGVGRSELDGRVEWALEWTGLAERRDRPVDTLSGGMRRRLNVACAVLHRPRVVLLDEPTAGIDGAGRERIRRMLDVLRGEGVALVQSTHEFDEVESGCDRVWILDRGRVLAQGTLEELISRTFGGRRTYRMVLDDPSEPTASPTPVDGTVERVEQELPRILADLAASGRRVRGLHVEAPGLRDVYERLSREAGR